MMDWQPGTSLDAAEKAIILKAYAFYKQNKTQTAQSLGIAIRTLDTKLERYEHENKMDLEKKAVEKARHDVFLRKQRGNPPNDIGLPYVPYEPELREDSLERHRIASPTGPRFEPVTNTSDKPINERKEKSKKA